MPNGSIAADGGGEVLSALRERELAELAELVADTHCPEGQIAPLAIAKRKGLTVSFNDYGDTFDGLLEHRSGRFHIYCNRARATTAARTRFTLAHELGHFFIDEHRLALAAGRAPSHGSLGEFQSSNPVEREADLFASHLLMPAARFRIALAERHGMTAVIELSQTFGTSLTSTAVKVIHSTGHACVLLKWSLRGYEWKQLSKRALALGMDVPDRSVREVPHACLASLSSTETAKRAFSTSVMPATEWLSSKSNLQHLKVRQDLVSLGRHGALALITLCHP